MSPEDQQRPHESDDIPEMNAPQEPAEEEDSPWATLFFGLVLIAGGIGLYLYFGKLEEEGGSVRMPAIAIMIYEFLGRTGLLVILGLLGGFMTWCGISELRNRDS